MRSCKVSLVQGSQRLKTRICKITIISEIAPDSHVAQTLINPARERLPRDTSCDTCVSHLAFTRLRAHDASATLHKNAFFNHYDPIIRTVTFNSAKPL